MAGLLAACASLPDRVTDIGALAMAVPGDKSTPPSLVNDAMRLHRVAYRLKRGAVAWCGHQVRRETGLLLWGTAATAELGLGATPDALPAGTRPAVLFVAPDSAAARAGLQPHDAIEALDGVPVAEGDAGLQQVRRWWRDVATSQGERQTTLQLRRQGARVEATIVPERVCDVSLTLELQSFPYASLRPEHRIVLTGGLLDALADDRLAFAIAHLLAHDLLGHRESGRRTANAAAVADLPFFVVGFALAIASMGAYPQAAAMPVTTAVEQAQRRQWEPQADQWALFMTAAAGFDVARVDTLPIVGDIGGFRLEATDRAERLPRLLETARSIEALRAAGIALEPSAEALKALQAAPLPSPASAPAR